MGGLDIKSMTAAELAAYLKELGEPSYRAAQIFSWLHQKQAQSFDEMHNLPLSLRERLNESCYIDIPAIERKLVSALDGTVKYLLRLCDGACVETVLMQYKYGYSLCVSSQVGCRMGCSFCASTKAGLVRSLLPSEIEGQLHRVQLDAGVRVGHVVLMGIGEPLDNFDNVLRFIRLVNDENGLNIGMRNISLSTCGVVDGIDRLAQEDLALTLSVSLHAPDDDIRTGMMPVNRKWNIAALLAACKRYVQRTKRRVSFEYALIDGVNDSDTHARALARLLSEMPGTHVNLIPVNPVSGTSYRKSNGQRIRAFQTILAKAGINATVRRELGSDISAACGQLRHDIAAKKED